MLPKGMLAQESVLLLIISPHQAPYRDSVFLKSPLSRFKEQGDRLETTEKVAFYAILTKS